MGKNAALGFGPDRIRILVSMATDSSNRVIMGKNSAATFSLLFFIRSFLYLQVTRTYMKNSDEFEVRPDPITDCEVRCH